MWKKIEKGIVQEGKYSFRVRLMVAGNRLDKTFDTLDEARAFRDLHKASAALDVHEAAVLEARGKKRAAKGFTVADAIEQYRTEKSEKKKGWESEGTRLNKLGRCKIAAKPLYQVHRDDILQLLDEIGGSSGNRKRYYNLVRHIFQIAVDEWKKLEKNPFNELSKADVPKDSKPRDRRLAGGEYEALLAALDGEAKVILILCVETAMRRGEVLALEWQHINLKKQTAYLPEHKTDEHVGARTVPLSSRAVAALKILTRGIKGPVFTIQEMGLRYQWRKTREAIGAPDLRIHDLRHEAASRLFERGLNVMEAASITGHKTLGMLKRYTHLNPTDLAKKLG